MKADRALKAIEVKVIEIREINRPTGEPPVHWTLVTTKPADSAEMLWKSVDYYRSRWTVDAYFKTIKAGCDDTSLQH